MNVRTACSLVALGLCLLLPPVSRAQELLVAPDSAQGIYQPGQTIRWKVQVTGADVTEAAFTVKTGGLTEVTNGKATLTDGRGQVEAKLDTPGWLLVDVSIKPAADKRITALGGALVSLEKIQPALPRPADFDAFWEGKLKDLAAVTMYAKLDPADSGKANVDYFKIAMDNIRGSRIHGQLARPKRGEKLPAMPIVQWAGVYPLQKGWGADWPAQAHTTSNLITRRPDCRSTTMPRVAVCLLVGSMLSAPLLPLAAAEGNREGPAPPRTFRAIRFEKNPIVYPGMRGLSGRAEIT